MIRRDVIKSLGLVSAHAMFPSVLASFLESCKSPETQARAFKFLTKEDETFVTEAIDIIIPATKTKSASQTGVQFFLDDVFGICLNEDQKALLTTGLRTVRDTWSNATDKKGTLTQLDQKAFSGDESAAWFKLFKQFTMIGFFTSQEGTTRAGDYQKIPDRFIGEVPADSNTLAHSNTTLRYYL